MYGCVCAAVNLPKHAISHDIQVLLTTITLTAFVRFHFVCVCWFLFGILQWRSGVNVLKRNSVRLAEVWLDDYAQYYYQRIGNEKGDFGDVTERRELR